MWEVIGYEIQKNVEGLETGITLYCSKPFRAGQGEGRKARRIWYRPGEIPYRPAVGDEIFIETEVRGKFEIVVDIYRA